MKKLLAITLALILAFSCVSVLPITAAAAETETQEIATKKAIYIGKTNATDKKIANIFYPITAQDAGNDGIFTDWLADDNNLYFKLTFKAEMLSGSNPIVSFLRRGGSDASKCGTYTEFDWVTSGKEASGKKYASFSYNEETNEYTYIFGIETWILPYGSPWGFLCIGNLESNNGWYKEKDYDASFIMTDPVLNVYYPIPGEEEAGEVNLIKDFSDANVNMDSAYMHVKNSEEHHGDSMIKAPADKWSVQDSPSLVKQIEVPADFFDGSNATFTKHAETDTTREYYTSDSYAGMYFEKIGETYKIINSIDKKMVVITANKDGDNRTATIGVPLQLNQYFISSENRRPAGRPVYAKVTFDAKRLSGNGQPMLTRCYVNGDGSYALGGSDGCAYNITEGEVGLPKSTYNPATGKFEGWVRLSSNYATQTAPNGVNEVILIGNSEMSGTDAAYDSSFAISNINVDLYDQAKIQKYYATLNYKAKDRWKYLKVERNLDAGTYQFDVDYKTEGNVKFGVSFNSNQTVTSTTDKDGHMTVTFTSVGGTFNIFLKDTLWTGTGKIHLANPVLKKVENGTVTGDNLVYDFAKQYSELGSTITETYQWGGKWYKSGADSNVVFTVSPDNGTFSTSTVGPNQLIASDIAPGFYEETINDSKSYINNDDHPNISIARASTSKWSVCGDAYMVNAYSITDCFLANHDVVYNAETNTNIEYYSCATCGKNYADEFGSEELADVSATQKMIIVKPAGNNVANAVMPLDFLDTPGTHYYLFKCRMKLFAEQELPSLSVMRATYHSVTGAYSENNQSAYGDPVNAGYMATLNYKAADRWKYLQVERNLDAGTYQFDIDYKTEGSVDLAVSFNSNQTVTSSVKENGHMTVTFTSKGGNFNIYLKDSSWTGTGKIHLANPVLKKVENGALAGDNLVYDFSKQYNELGSTISETYQYGGKWYKSGKDSLVEFTVQKDTNDNFNYLIKAGGEMWSNYDPETMTYTAVFKMDIAGGNGKAAYRYRSPETLAHHAILLGNAKHVGNGAANHTPYSAFAFTEPELYKLSDYNDITSIVSEDLCPNITDKSVNMGKSYTFGNIDKDSHCTAANNIMTAPVGKWSVDGSTSYVTACDFPENLFGEDTDAKMLRISGMGGNQYAIAYETVLEPGAKYQFDIDYRNYGGSEILIAPQLAKSSYATIAAADRTYTEANVDGSHMSFQFTVPTDARVNTNNFKLYLGRLWDASNAGSAYFANVQLRKVANGTLGDNLIYDGDFSSPDNNTVIKSTNISNELIGWADQAVDGYPQAKIMDIPEDFFKGDAKEVKDMAIKFTGGDWHSLQFKVNLEANTTYRLTYNYRAFGGAPTISSQRGGDAKGTLTINNISSHTDDEYLQTYELVTSEDYSLANNNRTPNTRILLSFGANSYDRELYISNVKLHKVVDGEIVGTNIVGDYNPIYTEDTYEGIEDGIALTLGQDDVTAFKSDLAHGWYATFGSDTNVEQYASLVNVADDFYTFIPYAIRMSSIRKDLLEIEVIEDIMNYDINADEDITLKDLVRFKKSAAGIEGADVEAEILYNKIMNAPNTVVDGTAYYVSNDGSDSNDGKSESTPFATITKAISVAKSGNAILLNRGDEWRIPVSTNDTAYAIPDGVTLGAYGEGDKPLINGSAVNYSDKTWTNEGGNVWKTSIVSGKKFANAPGNIYFYENETDKEPALIGTIIKDGKIISSKNDLTQEGDMFKDFDTSSSLGQIFSGSKNDVYVYCSENPATKYERIEIGEERTILYLNSNTNVDNIAIKHAGGHGIATSKRDNITITNCEIGYVGGAPTDDGVLGNGIQFGLGGENLVVENCYVYECCDAGITFQSWGETGSKDETEFKNVYFTDNLLTNNYYNIEFFTTGTPDYKVGANNNGNGKFTDIYITGNIMRFAGECWSFEQRLSNEGNYRCANVCVTSNAYYINTSNLNIKDNIFDCTMSSQVYWTWADVTADVDKTAHVGLNVSGNAFYQKAGSADSRVMRFGDVTSFAFASSQKGLEDAVAMFDSNPANVDWIEDSIF